MNTTWNPICLDGQWELFLEENYKCADFASDLHTAQALRNAGFLHISGPVPGNYELDMQKANLLPADLFCGIEPLNLMDLENRHLTVTLSPIRKDWALLGIKTPFEFTWDDGEPTA